MGNIKNKYDNLSDWEKVEFVKKIEFEDSLFKWDLYDTIIKNEKDYDLARIEAFKIIEIYEIPKQYKDKLSKSLEHIILTTNDDEVKNYAVSSSCNFMEYSYIKEIIKSILLNQNEDIDLRYGAFSSIQRIANLEQKNEILRKLLDDDTFKTSAQRILSGG